MKNSKVFVLTKRMLFLTAGAFFYALGVSLFLDPHAVAPGGITGIAVIIHHFTGWYTGFLSLVMNIPLMLAGLVKFGKDFLVSTIYSTMASSLFMSAIQKFTENRPVLTDDLLLCALVGGSAMGIGMGIVFRAGGTTGGTDIVVKFLRQKYRHLKSGAFFIILDSIVVTFSAIVYKDFEKGIYAAVAVVVCSYVFNTVLYGTDTARLTFIVSDKPDKIAARLLNDLDLGATYVKGEGAYTGNGKKVIMCASKKRIFPQVKEIVREEDADAFLIVTSANEIYGEGFKPNSNLEV